MSEKRKVRATITFFGEPCRMPKPEEKVKLRIADGSWQGGFRCISAPLDEDGEQRVWVARDEEYQAAKREGRVPVSDTWPLDALVGTDG
jgi:hypothetical protein